MKTYGLDFPFRKGWTRLKSSPRIGIQKLLRILADRNGPSRFINILSVSSRISRQYARYHASRCDTLAGQAPRLMEGVQRLRTRPTISLLMPVFNVDEPWLRLAIESVRKQIYPHWTLCIADDASTGAHVKPILEAYSDSDPRINVAFREVHGHISAALNTALRLAEGEFIALLDHDDEITPDALYEVASLLNEHPEADLIYSDEDRVEADGSHVEPYFKPDWSPHLLLSINYITHLAVLRRDIVQSIGGFRDEFVGSQDYDLFLRFTEKTDRIFHIPKVLYSWRKIPPSAALLGDAKPYASAASIGALADAAKRRGLEGAVLQGTYPPFLRFQYLIRGNPHAAIVMSFTAEVSARRALLTLQTLAAKTEGALEVVAVVAPHLIESLTRAAKRPGLTIIPALGGSLCEHLTAGAAEARGEYLAFVSQRAVPLAKDWLWAMMEYAQLPDVGCVGAKLLDQRGRILHSGLALGICGAAGSPGRGLADVPQLVFYLNMKDASREVSAVSRDCLVISRAKFAEAGGFRKELRSHYFDVDLCLRLAERAFRNIYTPHARLHLAAASAEKPNAASLDQDRITLRELWGDRLYADPFYNPNLTRLGDDMGIASPLERLGQ